jgi:hypothetical protein
MLLALGLGACALENPGVVVAPPGTTPDAATDLGAGLDVVESVDRPIPTMDLGFDAGTIDKGVVDTDTGVVDTGPPDTGPVDTGPLDTGPLDTGPLDTGPLDTGPLDTGPLDTGVVDTGHPDTGPLDTGPLDTGPVDTGPVDAGFPDVIIPRDLGGTDVPVTPTCGANGLGCCSPPSRCGANLSCQPQFLAPSRCLPCGGYLQPCCDGACRAGPCRVGLCTGI